MADEEELVEVGYGDDAEIVWTGGLTCLNDIDEILVGYESVEMDIAEDKLTKILDDLRNIEPSVPNAADFREASDLIINSLIIDKTFFDPDMPNASIRLQLKARKSEVPHLHDFGERAKSLFLQVFEEDGIGAIISNIEKEILENKTIQSRQEQFDIVADKLKRLNAESEAMLASLREVLIKPSGLFHIDPYLIDIDQEAIFVLISHNKYKKNRDESERRVSDALKLVYTVFEIEEVSSEPGRLPSFAGQHRNREMGWTQNKTSLLHADLLVVQSATQARDKLISLNISAS